MDLLAEQIRLETEAREQHRERWLDAVKDALADGRAGSVPILHRLMAEAYPLVEQGIQETLNDSTRGYGAQYRSIMRELGVRGCACLALSLAISGACANLTVTKLLSNMGKAVVAEVIYLRGKAMGAKEAGYMERVSVDVKRSKSREVNHVYNKVRASAANIGMELDVLPAKALITIGKLLMKAVQPTGLVIIKGLGGSARMRATSHFMLHDDVLATLKDWMDIPASAGGCYPPMIIPPAQINPNGIGGMWHSPGQAVSYRAITALNSKAYRACHIDPAPVIEACMELSSVPYRVNKMVLEFLRTHRTDIMGLPQEPRKPAMPFTVPEGLTFAMHIAAFPPQVAEEMEHQLQEYKLKSRLYYSALRKFSSQMISINSAIKEADTYAPYDAIYLPTYGDHRGRIYYSSLLNPQSGDAVRALLELAEPVPLGKDGLFWLKVHVANCFGYDATDFEDRAAWTDKTLPRLREGCRLPEAYESFWAEADYPLCGWAAASELIMAIDSGSPETFPSRTITQWDATCSGMQHFSAALRDAIGGATVNLIDSPKRKADIYLKTAQEALLGLEQSEAIQTSVLGQWLLRNGIQRDMAKKPVMTYLYGATRRGMVDFFAVYIREKRIRIPDGVKLLAAAQYLADIMWSTIPLVVPKAAEAMAWLQDLGRSEAKEGRYVMWTAPNGLVVPNLYHAVKETSMRLNLMGIHGIRVRQDLDRPDSSKCAAAIAPNFIHSLDASHMMFTLWALWNLGIYMVSVHDSFGCAAAHAGTMHRVLREQFVRLYEENDPFGELASEYGITAPDKGTLDIKLVLKSSKFFG